MEQTTVSKISQGAPHSTTFKCAVEQSLCLHHLILCLHHLILLWCCSCDYDWSLAVVVVGWLLLFVITFISAFLAAPHWKENSTDHNDIELSSNAISRKLLLLLSVSLTCSAFTGADTHNIESSDDKTEVASKAVDDSTDVKYNPPAPHEPNSPIHRSKQDNRV